MNTKLSKERIIQIVLGAIIILLLVIVIVLTKKEPEIPFVLNGESDVTLDETLPGDEGDKTPENNNVTTTKTTTTSTPVATTPAPVAGTCKTTLTAKKLQNPNGIGLYWNTCTSDDFQFYKLVKSQTNPNPSYPNDSVLMSSTNYRVSNYLDRTVANMQTYHYSLCVVQRLNKITCSNKVTINY